MFVRGATLHVRPWSCGIRPHMFCNTHALPAPRKEYRWVCWWGSLCHWCRPSPFPRILLRLSDESCIVLLCVSDQVGFFFWNSVIGPTRCFLSQNLLNFRISVYRPGSWSVKEVVQRSEYKMVRRSFRQTKMSGNLPVYNNCFDMSHSRFWHVHCQHYSIQAHHIDHTISKKDYGSWLSLKLSVAVLTPSGSLLTNASWSCCHTKYAQRDTHSQMWVGSD